MPIKKWAFQYIAMITILFLLLSSIQYLKNMDLEYSLGFGALWAFISTTLFLGTRIHNYRKNIYCALCDDLSPEKNHDNKKY